MQRSIGAARALFELQDAAQAIFESSLGEQLWRYGSEALGPRPEAPTVINNYNTQNVGTQYRGQAIFEPAPDYIGEPDSQGW